MTCKFDKRLLTQYSDGVLSQAQQAQVRAHVSTCPDCAYDLHILTSAVAQLRMNAAQPMVALPDLYNGFRERLMTRPTRFRSARYQARIPWIWRMAGIIVPVSCVLMISLVLFLILASHQYNIHHPGYMDVVDSAFREALNNPSDKSETWLNFIKTHPTSITVHWCVQRSGRQTWTGNYMVVKRDPVTRHWSVRSADHESSDFHTSTGVKITYRTAPSNDPSTRKVHLIWEPKDPDIEPDNLKDTFLQSTRSVLNLLAVSDTYGNADTEVMRDGENQKITLNNINATISKSTQSYIRVTPFYIPNFEINLKNFKLPIPDSIEVWVDAQNRLCREKVHYAAQTDVQLIAEVTLNYADRQSASSLNTLFVGLEPNLPYGQPVVVGPYPTDANNANSPVAVAQQIELTWLSMSETEKKQIQEVVARFARTWKEHDEAALRSLVDVAWPLEITRPDKRNHLTEADVWQRVWQQRLSNEPKWKEYDIAFDFAYSYEKHLLDSPPLDADEIDYRAALPGLNVLAWVKARQPDGKTASFSARLYLVKRAGVWKIYQFVRSR